MARNTSTLTVKIVSDASGATKGFDEAESRVGRFRSGLDKASVAAGGVLVGMAGIAKSALDSASALQQSTGAINSVFGDWAVDIEQAAQKAATAVGLSTSAYNEAAALIGAQLKGLGFPIDENVAATQQLITVGADLAATFGGTTADAVAALSSALKGERDPIEAYGITLSQAAIDAKIAAMGLDTSTEASKRNAGAVATMALINEQAGGAMGAFAREVDTAAGSTQIAAAQYENAKAALGEVLLPIVAAAMEKFSAFTAFLVANKDTVLIVAGVLGGLAATVLLVNGIIATVTALTAAWTAAVTAARIAQFLWNLAIAANPIMLIVTVIAAVIAAIVLAYNKFSWFRDIVDAVGSALKWAFDKARGAIEWVIDKLSFIGDAAGWVGDLFSAPQTMAITPVAAGSAAGLFGAADGQWAPIRGAARSSLTGGTSPSSGQGPSGQIVHVTVNGALDPQAVADQIAGLLRRRALNRGLTPTVAL